MEDEHLVERESIAPLSFAIPSESESPTLHGLALGEGEPGHDPSFVLSFVVGVWEESPSHFLPSTVSIFCLFSFFFFSFFCRQSGGKKGTRKGWDGKGKGREPCVLCVC